MWNIDIETRVRELNTQAENRSARLLDTMTETDGSAKLGRIALSRLAERCMGALGRKAGKFRSFPARPASIAPGK